MAKVYVSYRREDADNYAQAIRRRLEQHLPADQILMDVDTIKPGVDFVSRIQQAVSDSVVVIALIGKGWMGERANAPARIHDPRDSVHLEIETALARGIRVIPVLVNGATFPRNDELPQSLQPLLRRNALEWSITRYAYDLERISQAVQTAVGPTSIEKHSGVERRPWTLYGGLFVTLIVLGIAGRPWFKGGQEKQTEVEKVSEPIVAPTKPPVKAQPPEGETQIKDLLARAKKAENKDRLTTPAEDNAATYYREVLQLDKDNPDAQQGLERIVGQYVALAEEALSKRQLDKAAANLKNAESVIPDNPALAEFRGRLEEEKTRETEQRQATASVKTFRDPLKIGGEGPEMVVIRAGSFWMGSPESEAGRANHEGPRRKITLHETFALGRHEVTVGEFRAFVNATGYDPYKGRLGGCRIWTGKEIVDDNAKNWKSPGFAQTDQHPVVCINWHDANSYVNWLKSQTGKSYRLPSEAEWEYATRGGTTTSRYWGNGADRACGYANVADKTLERKFPALLIHNCQDGHVYTAPVGSYGQNRFGLKDTLGNVWEWVEDCWHENYEGSPTEGSAWLEAGGGNCSQRVIRGGSWLNDPAYLRVANRFGGVAVDGTFDIGLRLAQDLP